MPEPSSCCAPRPNQAPAPPANVSSPTAPKAPEATHDPLSQHAATRDVRESKSKLAELGALIEGTAPTPQLSVQATLRPLRAIPQYDRTHVPGCVCKPAIAGGACCPSSLGSMSAQQVAGAHAHGHSGSHALLGAFTGALGMLGIYSAYQVVLGARDALAHVMAVDAYAQRQQGVDAVLRERLGSVPDLTANQLALAKSHQGYTDLRRDLKYTRDEQAFYLRVPGFMQMAASVGALWMAASHSVPALAAPLWGLQASVVSPLLFSLYGATMGLKNIKGYVAGRNLPEPPCLPPQQTAYLAAHAAHHRRKQRQLLMTALSWLGVSAAGLMGAAVSGGLLSLPHGWALVGAITVGAGLFAMWNNSCSRYAPHLPVGPHMARRALTTRQERAELYGHLGRQQQALLAANTAMAEGTGALTKLKMRYEEAVKPQCGAEAFTVLPSAVAAQARESDARAQLQAVLDYCRAEESLLKDRYHAEHQSLTARTAELARKVSPGCAGMKKTAARELAPEGELGPLFTDAAERLEADARELTHKAHAQTALRACVVACEALQAQDAPIAVPRGTHASSALTPAQRQWLLVRVHVLQQGGLLRDGVSQSLVEAHGDLVKTVNNQHTWPLLSLQALPERLDAWVTAMAPEIEVQFAHAFFNPRRIEAELDYLLELETSERLVPQASAQMPFAAPGAQSATCCAPPQ